METLAIIAAVGGFATALLSASVALMMLRRAVRERSKLEIRAGGETFVIDLRAIDREDPANLRRAAAAVRESRLAA